jgi:amiloride-sensitive sodium channel subunit alpha/amiloride-sensitive sodium channel subunit gamma
LKHEDLKGGFIRIHIYYDSLDYTSITESVKFSGSDLISNIGGTLGLFIGISVLSFVEIIEIIIEIFLIFAKNKISTVELFKKKLTKKSSAPLPS